MHIMLNDVLIKNTYSLVFILVDILKVILSKIFN